MFTTMAVGTLITSLFLTSMGGMRNKGGFFAMALIDGSICFAGIALSPTVCLAMACFYLWGSFGGFFVSMSHSLLQSHTPQEVMGRVMSVNALVSQGTMPLGALVAGLIVSLTDVRTAALIPAVLCAPIATLALLFIPRFRRLS
jgi:sugar phosphate permease